MSDAVCTNICEVRSPIENVDMTVQDAEHIAFVVPYGPNNEERHFILKGIYVKFLDIAPPNGHDYFPEDAPDINIGSRIGGFQDWYDIAHLQGLQNPGDAYDIAQYYGPATRAIFKSGDEIGFIISKATAAASLHLSFLFMGEFVEF